MLSVNTMAKIFLCHANEDKPRVREVYHRLKAEGFEPWFDETDILPGQVRDQEIRRALKNSDFILIFFSQNSVTQRGYLQREMKLALDAWQEMPEGHIHTIPIRLDAGKIPESFQQFEWVDCFGVGGWERLLRALRTGVGQRQRYESAYARISSSSELGIAQHTNGSKSEGKMEPRERHGSRRERKWYNASRRTQVWVAIIGSLGLLLAAITTGYFGLLPNVDQESHRFTPDHPTLNPFNRTLILSAANTMSQRKIPLDVEFDGLVYPAKGIPHREPKQFTWEIVFQEFLDKGKLQQGLHTLRVGFPGKQFSEPLKIEFYIESPIVEATLENVPGTPYNKLLTGEALSKRQDPQEWLKIDLFFHHEGEPIHISLPVTRVIDEQTKRVHFSFQAPIENIPHIPQDDQRYGAPFFAFQVTDEAGNKYYNVLSYAQFVAPGKNHFGVGSVADFLVQKFKGEKDSNTVMDFQLVPTASSAKRFMRDSQP